MQKLAAALLLLSTATAVHAQAVPSVTGGGDTRSANLPDVFSTLHNDFNTVDTAGQPVRTRSGSLAFFNGVFYWYGGNPRGFREQYCYSSTDLVHWKSHGVILQHNTDANRIEVLYNDSTKQYVMFLKYDGNGAHFAVATADKPEGPFTIRNISLIDNALIGDMSVFKDDDGTAYLCYVSWAKGTNAQHAIYKMSADYLTAEKQVYLWDKGGREAPHVFKRNGLYYYGTSETAWIDSSGTKYYTAKSLAGPWSAPVAMQTPGSDNTWDSQCNFVFPIQGTEGTTYLYVGDRWLRDAPAGRNGGFVFLPMEFDGDTPVLRYHQDWDLNLHRGTWRTFDASRDLAAGKPVTASSQTPGHAAGNVTQPTTFSNYVNTFWESDSADPQSLVVDLGEAKDFNRVVLKWNKAAAKSYRVQTSTDGQTWGTVFKTDDGSANVVADLSFQKETARYVRVLGTVCAPVQVETRRRVPGNPAAATRPSTQATQPAPPMRYSLFKVSVFND
ncbi:MAG: family 43 glycosylhydrolase [Tepidisphaeraceae bacterium]